MMEGPPRSEPSKEQKIEAEITKAQSFEDLYSILDKMGGLQGSHTFYPADKLKQLIEEVREGKKATDYITRTGGLRTQVIWLATAESQSKGEQFEPIPAMPKVGEQVVLIKVAVQEGKASEIAKGSGLTGQLMRDIQIGEKVLLNSGQTSEVRSIRSERGKIFVDTMTSTYEVSPVRK